MTRSPSLKAMTRSFSLASLLVLGVTAASLAGAVSASAAGASHRVKMTLAKSIPPNPVFHSSGACGFNGANDSAACNASVLKAIDDARRFEPAGPIRKSFNLAAFDKLSRVAQLFAITDIERVARGLAPVAGLTAQLDRIAETAAIRQTDPSPSLPLRISGGGTATAYGSNWAEGTANPMGADYYWMYDDGLNSPNILCTQQNQTSCWGHRENILGNWENPAYCAAGSKVHLLMGAAEVTKRVVFSPSITQVFVNDCGQLPAHLVISWTQVKKLIFTH
jgi:hypothetical protein